MARGYKTGGRKKGSPNKATAQQRDEMAKAAAPYVHPRLAAVDAQMEVHMSHEEMLRHLE